MRRSRTTDPSLFWEECLAVLAYNAQHTGSVKLTSGDLYAALAECTLGERDAKANYNWWGHKLRNVASAIGKSPASATEGTRVWIRRAIALANGAPVEARDLAARALTSRMQLDLAAAIFGNGGMVDLGSVGLTDTESLDAEAGYAEGGRRLVLHYRRERASGATKTAKRSFRERNHGALFCEVCTLNPEETKGFDIIEAHHRIPLALADGLVETKASDFVMLCPNCHRSVHLVPNCDLSALRERTFAR
jgi:hypothetical protein